MNFIKFFEKLDLSPSFLFRNHSWVSINECAESFTEVVTNMPIGSLRLPAELQLVVTKESGMNHKCMCLCICVYDLEL